MQYKQAGLKTHMHLHGLFENESLDALRQSVENFHYLDLTIKHLLFECSSAFQTLKIRSFCCSWKMRQSWAICSDMCKMTSCIECDWHLWGIFPNNSDFGFDSGFYSDFDFDFDCGFDLTLTLTLTLTLCETSRSSLSLLSRLHHGCQQRMGWVNDQLHWVWLASFRHFHLSLTVALTLTWLCEISRWISSLSLLSRLHHGCQQRMGWVDNEC